MHKVEYGSGRVVIVWSGTVVERSADAVAVQAIFAPKRPDPIVVDGVPFCAGDVFTEYYFPGRWYNVFHIQDPDGRWKGWYCNVTRPASFADGVIAFVDMALDLFVHPDGHYTVLDEDEFEVARAQLYTAEDAARARTGLDELVALARAGALPAPSPRSPHGG